MFIRIHNAACTVHIYQVIVCKMTQNYVTITVHKHLHTPATFQHASVVATTTITREDNSKDQKIHRYLSYLVIHTRIYFGAPATHNLFTLPISVRSCTVLDQSVDNVFEFLTLEDGSDKLPGNNGKKLPVL
jgi:hypothetical protein